MGALRHGGAELGVITLVVLAGLGSGVAAAAEQAGRVAPGARPVAVEATDRALAGALMRLETAPTAVSHFAVGEEYLRLGILDKAFDHFAETARLAPSDAAAFDSMARIWRRWRAPHLGLADAWRAVGFAPRSPVPRNTLGTLLFDLGRVSEAREQFVRALELDGGAIYALRNLCAALQVDPTEAPALAACRQAVTLAEQVAARPPTGAAADPATARVETRAADLIRIGIDHLAHRRQTEATAALREAAELLSPDVPATPSDSGRLPATHDDD